MTSILNILGKAFRPLRFFRHRWRVQGWRTFWPWRGHDRIVLISWSNALGDSLVCIPAMKALCRHYQALGYKVIGVSSGCYPKTVESAVSFDEIRYVDIGVFMKDEEYRVQTLRGLYNLRAEIQIDMLMSNGTQEAFMLTLLPAAKFSHKLYWYPEESEYEGGYWHEMETTLKQANASNDDMQAFTRHCRIWRQRIWRERRFVRRHFDQVWCIRRNENEIDFRLRVASSITGTPANADFSGAIPATTENSGDADKYYLLVAGGNNVHRRWPAERFANVINHLRKTHPELKARFIGSQGDCAITETVMAKLGTDTPAENLCGKTDISQLLGLIAGTEFLISNDTGTAHLASLMQKKVFCLLSAAETNRYFPNPHYKNAVSLRLDVPCKNCRGGCFFSKNPGLERCVAALTSDIVIAKMP